MRSLLHRLIAARRRARAGPSRAAPAATQTCPSCDATVLAAARICRHCRHRLDGWDELLREVG